MKTKKFKISFMLISLLAFTMSISAQDNIEWKTNFGGIGGNGNNQYYSVKAVSDGVIAIGSSNSFGNGDWTGVAGKGGEDAIIVKYNNNGNVVWRTNFGGRYEDSYNSVTAVSDGIIAVGDSEIFGDGDWVGVTGNGNDDAIIVKYDNNGNVVWKRNFGGRDDDSYNSVTAVSDGIIAVGNTDAFGYGDWVGVTGNGSDDAIIVKYDNNGNVVWKKNFGGRDDDEFNSVIAVSDGIIVVGYSDAIGTGDWTGFIGNGSEDAIIVKYDNNGNVVWKKNFGGRDEDSFDSVTAVPDGIIAVGYSDAFGYGDWAGVMGKGGDDAIVVKYDNNGNVVWKTNFGGLVDDEFNSVTTVSDGIIAVGNSDNYGFGAGDWTGVAGKGGDDAIIVKYDNNGNVVSKMNFGGYSEDDFHDVTAVSDGVIAVGYSNRGSFGNGDWYGVAEKGNSNAIIVKYGRNLTSILEPASTVSGLIIYPNPTEGQLAIDNGQSPINDVKIFDVMGKIAATYSFTDTTANIDVSQLQPGIYFVHIEGKIAKLVVK